MSVEVMVSGQESARVPAGARLSGWARRHRTGLVVAALLGALAVGADQWQQQRELARLVAIVDGGESAIDSSDRRVAGIVTFYSPAITSASRSAGLEASFRGAVGDAAAGGVAAGSRVAQQLDAVRVLPWHRGVRDARTAYQERIALWRTYLTTISGDPGALYGSQATLDASAESARAALVAALPWSATADAPARIAAPFR